jgi:hypothetical protein
MIAGKAKMEKWYEKCRRYGQNNLTEIDHEAYSIRANPVYPIFFSNHGLFFQGI